MPKELIRLSDCTVSFDGEVVLDKINLYINELENTSIIWYMICCYPYIQPYQQHI